MLRPLLIIVLTFAAALGQPGPHALAQAPVVAAVDLQKLFTSCPQANALQTKLQSLQAEINTDLEGRRTEIQGMNSDLEEIAPGTPAHTSKQEEIMLASLNLQAYGEFQQARIRREQLSGFLQLYQSIQSAIESVAAAQGIDMVIQYRAPVLPQVENYEQMQAAVLSRIMLYASDKAMITNLVLEQLTLMDKQ